MLTKTATRLKETVTLVEDRVKSGKSEDALKDLAFLSQEYATKGEWDKANAASRHMLQLAEGNEAATFDVLPEDLEFHLSRTFWQKRKATTAWVIACLAYVGLMAAMVGFGEAQQHPEFFADLRCHVLWFDPQSFIDRANVYWRKGQLSSAMQCCQQALRISPKSEDAINLKANILFEQGQFEEAASVNELRNKTACGYWFLKSAIEQRRGQFVEAARDFHTGANISKSTSNFVSERYLWALAGNYKEALKASVKAMEVARNSYEQARAYSSQARCLVKLGRSAEAVAACEKAIELEPCWSAIYAVKAEALLGEADYSGAVEAASQSLSLNPYYGRAFAVRAEAFEKLGRFDDAACDRRSIQEYGRSPSQDL